MTELELIVQLHKSSIRQGPGSDEDTFRALQMIPWSENQQLRVADLGCGSGAQTLILASNIKGQITAVDIFPDFLEVLEQRSEKAGLKHKITPLQKSMDELPFGSESLDLIWSEGAIYNIGFENGINYWKNFLKPNGYLVVSEITWLTHQRPAFLEDYWMSEYPEIDTASAKIKILENHNFTMEGYFNLSERCWLDNYYIPLEQHFNTFLSENHFSEEAEKVVKNCTEEIELYRQYKSYYSYGFYIARKNG